MAYTRAAVLLVLVVAAAADWLLDAGSGLTWRVISYANGSAALGQPMLHGRPLDALAVGDGIAFWRRASDFLVVDVFAGAVVVDPARTYARLSGTTALPGGASTRVSVNVTLDRGSPSAAIDVGFTASADVRGWQLCVKWASDGDTADAWRAFGYPTAGNSSSVDAGTLSYMGWPGFLLSRPNASVVAWYGLSASRGFTDPTGWTGATSFWMTSGGPGHQIAPQFAFGGGGIAAGVAYNATLRLVASDAGETLAAVRDIVPALLALDGYAVQSLAPARPPADMLACFVNARRTTPEWVTTCNGSAYRLQNSPGYPAIYVSSTPASALLDYRVYRATDDAFWRARAFEQMDFWMKGQHAGNDRHAGAFHTAYDIPSCTFNSDDRGGNRGWKIDMNGHAVRYALLMWDEVRAAEGLDVGAWRTAAAAAAEWLFRMGAAQAAPAGAAPGAAGFPQKIDAATDAPTPSVVSARLMNALPVMARLLGDSPAANFSALAAGAEAWLRATGEADLFFTAQHPDLSWDNYDGDGVWGLVEHWLDVHDATGAAEPLSRALGDAYVGLLMWCPTQLPWVTHPTQMARDEQRGYSQFSVYNYQTRIWASLTRLGALTGDPLWRQLADRHYALNAFTQAVGGGGEQPADIGGFFEAIADPWLARGGGYDFMGTTYLNELALDLNLQLLLAGVTPTPNSSLCVVPRR